MIDCTRVLASTCHKQHPFLTSPFIPQVVNHRLRPAWCWLCGLSPGPRLFLLLTSMQMEASGCLSRQHCCGNLALAVKSGLPQDTWLKARLRFHQQLAKTWQNCGCCLEECLWGCARSNAGHSYHEIGLLKPLISAHTFWMVAHLNAILNTLFPCQDLFPINSLWVRFGLNACQYRYPGLSA